MITYKLTSDGGTVLCGNRSIPVDENNKDYRDYLDWVNEGNVPEPADSEPDVLSLTTDSPVIIGDGVDEIMLGVQGKANALITIDVLVGVTPSTVNVQLDEIGNGSQGFSCETPSTLIVFSHGNHSVKVRAL